MNSSKEEQKSDFRRPDRLLMLAMVLGPTAVLAHEALAYTLVPEACERGSKLILHCSSLGFFIVALIAAFLGRKYRAGFDDEVSDDRIRFMATSAFVLGLGSAMTIIAMDIPNWILRSCD